MNRDWTEDFSHENGNYMNRCVECGELFNGHKRRVVCKACATQSMSNTPKPVGAELIANERNRQIKKIGYSLHDDFVNNSEGELLAAALHYMGVTNVFPWPWKTQAPEGKSAISKEDLINRLTKAGALIAAEIDRIANAEHIAADVSILEIEKMIRYLRDRSGAGTLGAVIGIIPLHVEFFIRGFMNADHRMSSFGVCKKIKMQCGSELSVIPITDFNDVGERWNYIVTFGLTSVQRGMVAERHSPLLNETQKTIHHFA